MILTQNQSRKPSSSSPVPHFIQRIIPESTVSTMISNASTTKPSIRKASRERIKPKLAKPSSQQITMRLTHSKRQLDRINEGCFQRCSPSSLPEFDEMVDSMGFFLATPSELIYGKTHVKSLRTPLLGSPKFSLRPRIKTECNAAHFFCTSESVAPTNLVSALTSSPLETHNLEQQECLQTKPLFRLPIRRSDRTNPFSAISISQRVVPAEPIQGVSYCFDGDVLLTPRNSSYEYQFMPPRPCQCSVEDSVSLERAPPSLFVPNLL